MEMREKGYTYKQISQLLNESNFTTRNGGDFTPQQVWGLEYKMKSRLRRLDKITPPKIKVIGLSEV